MGSDSRNRKSEPFVPELWTDKILDSFIEGLTFPEPRMIEQKKLDSLITESAEMEPLSDIHEALVELRWRRRQMAKQQKKLDRVKIGKQAEEHIEQTTLAEHMRRLKFW